MSVDTDQREKVEEEVAVFPDDVESPAAEVDEIVELLARPVAAVDHVHLQSIVLINEPAKMSHKEEEAYTGCKF